MTHEPSEVRPIRQTAVLDRHLPAIRDELDDQRRLRSEQLSELVADAAEAIAEADVPRRQVTRVLQLAAEAALRDIDAALERIADGSYGICERCTEPIVPERLEILPTSRLCTPCQQLVESERSRALRRGAAAPGSSR
jgi:RNA polymerase-binding transcription factor DksA